MTDLGGSLKSAEAYRTISEVAADLKLPQHVLRFWETRFSQVKPLKRAGGRRFYCPEDVDLLRAVKALLYGDGYTIKGVQRLLREQGPKAVAALAASPSRRGPSQPAPSPSSRPTIERAAVEPPPVLRPLPVPVAPAQGSALREASLDLPTSALPTARLRVVLADIEDCARILAELRKAAG